MIKTLGTSMYLFDKNHKNLDKDATQKALSRVICLLRPKYLSRKYGGVTHKHFKIMKTQG